MKKVRKRMGSLLLSVCMVLTMLPTVAFADSTSQITVFADLAEDVALQEVEFGTPVEALNLPSTLNVTVTSDVPSTATVSTWVYDPVTVNPSAYTFAPVEYGYGTTSYLDDAEAKTFTITNTGNTELTGLALGNSNDVKYWSDVDVINDTLAPKASADFTVKPISGLFPGTYTTTISVRSSGTVLASVPVSLTVTERVPRLRFGLTDVHEVDTDFSGTGYSWNATTKTLTLTSDYGAGSIEFLDFDSETAILKLDGDVTIDETASWGSCLYNSGNLTIDLDGHTLKLITGDSYNEALYGGEITIQNGTLVARLQGSYTENDTSSIYALNLTVENATVIADADSLNYGGIFASDNLTLKQGAKVYTSGSVGLLVDCVEFNLESDAISLTAIGSSSAVDLYADLDYTAGSALKFWTNTDTTQPSPAGEGTLLSSKTDDECKALWVASKYVYIGTESPKSIVTVTNGTGSGEYSENAVVRITADTATSGKRFKEWTVISGNVTLANPQASSTTFTMPANDVEVTATYEDISTSTPVTGSLNIGVDSANSTSGFVSDLRYDARGTNWSWDASANTLTLTGAIGGNGAIIFEATGDITVTVNGDVSATVLKYFESSAEGSPGKLNINGYGILTLTNTYTNDKAISTQGGLEIADITVNVSTVGNYSNAVHVYAGNFTMESGTLNLSTTGNYSNGIYCDDGSILISGTAQVKTNPSVVYYGLYVGSGKNIEISGGTVDVTSTNGTGIIANREVRISGGMVTSKSTSAYGAVFGVTDGVTVSGGTLVTGAANASPVNGSVGSDLTVSGANTQVTVNGSIRNNSNLTVSDGNVTVVGTVQGSQNLTGGTVYVNGVQVYPSAFTYAVTVNNGMANPSTASAGATVTITANTPDNGKRFKEWTIQSGGVTLANSQASSTTFTMPANAVEVTATYTSGGGSSSGGSSGGSSPSGSSSANTATIKENQPNQPVTAVFSVTATVGTNGIASASIPDKAVTDAISKAQAEATKQKKTENGISIGLNVTMPKGATTLTATLSQNALNSLVSAGVKNLEINGSPVTVIFDQKALKEIQKQSNGNVNIAIAPQVNLSETARAIIGTRPVYNITVGHGNNDTVSSFGEGVATIAIPYTPANGEAISGLYAVYVDENGNATRVDGSAYDVNSGSVLFTTSHFSMYGVGYIAPSEKLTDISNHWAKESISYVVDREILSGIVETTFAPNTAMIRGMLVTALGRLAEVDVSSYTTSSFTDVKVGSTSQPYIEWAYEAEIIHGIGNNEFAPDRAITREEIAVIIANFTKATGYTLPVVGEATTYADASSIGSIYSTAVTAMQQAGIMMGGTDNKFNPKSNATRAEVSSMLHRYIKLTIDSGTNES